MILGLRIALGRHHNFVGFVERVRRRLKGRWGWQYITRAMWDKINLVLECSPFVNPWPEFCVAWRHFIAELLELCVRTLEFVVMFLEIVVGNLFEVVGTFLDLGEAGNVGGVLPMGGIKYDLWAWSINYISIYLSVMKTHLYTMYTLFVYHAYTVYIWCSETFCTSIGKDRQATCLIFFLNVLVSKDAQNTYQWRPTQLFDSLGTKWFSSVPRFEKLYYYFICYLLCFMVSLHIYS